MTVEDDAIQCVRELQEITNNTRESHKKPNKNALEIYLKETAAQQLRQKKENVRVRNGGAVTVVGAEWPEARKFDGSWWKKKRVSRGGGGTSKHLWRDKERDDWPEQCGRRRNETAAAQRWQGARVVVSRGGLAWWSRRKSLREEETTTTAAQRWQHNGGNGSTGDGGSGSTGARVVGVADICREKWRRQRARGRKGFAI
ncbi:hypothetical protein DEO72_LG2g2193 [Vigna unguiculata]|uniref:Uncharacterized protein n=1 Tax=Vigna unguiculata TaxID=3917 RepID=A0A4D6KYJ7_VIGUN|nr:hypothetical protein DEO72_LG2g2193 [Vigna unguiculata]